MNKFRRGQVWFRNNKLNCNSRVQSGSRPVLIFSSDKGNDTSDIVSVIPMTSQRKENIDINVVFKDHLGKRQTILCNMLMPIDKSELTKYMFTVPDYIMVQVEKAVAISNEMKYQEDTDSFALMKVLQHIVENYISNNLESIIESKVKECVEKQQITRSKSESEGSSKIDSHKEKKEDTDDESINPMKDALKRANIYSDDSFSNNCKPQKESNKRRKWTIELCNQFIEDKLNLTMSEMKSKYNMDGKQICQYFIYCNNKLNKLKKTV